MAPVPGTERPKPRCPEEVQLEDVDFDVVAQCSDKLYLKRYIKLLEEDGGYFHELLKAAKDKLLDVAPKEYYMLYPRVASDQEVLDATRDLLDWECSVKETDAALRSSKKSSVFDDDAGGRTRAPIRGQEPVMARAMLQKPEGDYAAKGPKEARDVYARDKTKMKDYYSAWDKVDVDQLEEDVDEEERAEEEARRRHFDELKEEQDEANRSSGVSVDGLPDGVPQAHRKHLADSEKEKGNEAFHSKDYEEAEAYYSRSLHFRADDPSTWANRALVRLKMEKFDRALEDCEHALALNGRYMKALHRKGKCLYELGRYEEAVRSFQMALQESPGNTQINGDLMVARRKLRSEPSAPPQRPRRVDDPPSCVVEELPDDEPAPAPPPPAAGYTRVQIEEDSDSEDDDGVEIEEVKAAPAATPAVASQARGFRKVAIEEVSGSDDEDEPASQTAAPARPLAAPAAPTAPAAAPAAVAPAAPAAQSGFRKVQIVEEDSEDEDDAKGQPPSTSAGFNPPSRFPASGAGPTSPGAAQPKAAAAPAAQPAPAPAAQASVCFDDMD